MTRMKMMRTPVPGSFSCVICSLGEYAHPNFPMPRRQPDLRHTSHAWNPLACAGFPSLRHCPSQKCILPSKVTSRVVFDAEPGWITSQTWSDMILMYASIDNESSTCTFCLLFEDAFRFQCLLSAHTFEYLRLFRGVCVCPNLFLSVFTQSLRLWTFKWYSHFLIMRLCRGTPWQTQCNKAMPWSGMHD